MLDIARIREKPDEVKAALEKRLFETDFTDILGDDKRRRELIAEVESLKARRNDVSKQIPLLKKEGKPVADVLGEMKEVSGRIDVLDAQVSEVESRIRDALSVLPNIPADDVPAGGKENNEVMREWGHKQDFGFEAKDHIDLAEGLYLIDYKRGAKMGGRGFWLYSGDGALMEWALLNYFIESHIRDGYKFMLPPHILTWECGFTAGQFPKFADDVFHLKGSGEEARTRFLLPTSETALINLYRDEVLAANTLPRKFFAYSPCYRKEAGSYRTAERGMIRGHQFNKVEMFQFTTPETSDAALDELVGKAEGLVQGLGLHHRVSKLAAADCSAAMAKTYDVEVWIPSMCEYKEVSSASDARDYQARRGSIRFKREGARKTEYVHTLNASGLATSRLLPAILEQFQQSDGTVLVPEVLRKWVDKDVLRARE